MNVLVFFQFSNHNHAIDELCNNLNKSGIEASSFNIVSWRFRNEIKKRKALWISLISVFAIIPGLRGLLTTWFRDKALLKLSENYAIIDIHFFSPVYDKLIEELKNRGKKVKITIWGSDFYRVDTKRREQQRRIYNLVDLIQIETRQIAKDFLKVYPEFDSKVRLAHFGVLQFDIIDKLLQNGNSDLYKKELKLPKDKIILTCGTNRSSGHQHQKILESIESLAPEIKEQLFLIIPMTYGGEKSYIETIRQKTESLGLPYIIISSFLSLNELCKFRIVSDICLTIQKTDALASAIQEHLYTEEILIAGEWLPYQILNKHDIFYLTSSMESLTGTISNTVKNYQSLKKKCFGNNAKLSSLSSWNNVIKDWIKIYNEIYTKEYYMNKNVIAKPETIT